MCSVSVLCLLAISNVPLIFATNSGTNHNKNHNNNVGISLFTNAQKYSSDVLRMLNNMPFDVPFDMGTKIDNVQVNESYIAYYLFNATHPDGNFTIPANLAGINPKLKVKLFVHGWTEHNYVQWCVDIRKAYVTMGNFNVIVSDWSKIGDSDYMTASLAAVSVGEKIGDFVVKLHDKLKIPYKNIHVVSHSLGCHVAGFIGKRVYEVTGKKVGRLTALDPAAPIFEMPGVNEERRLNKNDAVYVDIVHTDGGTLGFRETIGTADFFPNGGVAVQPGCSLLRADVQYEDLFCSHARSHRYFLRSIYDNKIMARPCSSWDNYQKGMCGSSSVLFGAWSSNKLSGKYFFKLAVPTDTSNYSSFINTQKRYS